MVGCIWSLRVGWPPGLIDNEIKNYWNTNIGKKNQVGDHHTKRRPSSTTPSEPQLQEINPNPSMGMETEINPNPSMAKETTSPAHTASSSVVRTKATRCTKVGQSVHIHVWTLYMDNQHIYNQSI
jgi:myb proto-oncogene protein